MNPTPEFVRACYDAGAGSLFWLGLWGGMGLFMALYGLSVMLAARWPRQ